VVVHLTGYTRRIPTDKIQTLMQQQKKQQGFTLLEVLITIIIVAAASATTLGQMRGLMDLNKRMRRHHNDATLVLNTVAQSRQLKNDYQITQQTIDSITLQPKKKDYTINVKNFSTYPKTPSISLAYTPYQQYLLNQQYYSIILIQPGLINKSP